MERESKGRCHAHIAHLQTDKKIFTSFYRSCSKMLVNSSLSKYIFPDEELVVVQKAWGVVNNI